MMRNLPPCPRCQEPELWLSVYGTLVTVKCYECGWWSVLMTDALDGLDAQIAATVAAAQEHVPEPVDAPEQS